MAEQLLLTLDGGIPQILIKGEITENEEELYRLIGKAAHKFPTLLLNLLEVTSTNPVFIEKLEEFRTMSRLKIVAGTSPIRDILAAKQYQLFPSVKSALLAINGEETQRTILNCLEAAPVLSGEAYQVLSYMNNPQADVDGVVKRIEGSQNICGQILKAANSVTFSPGTKVDTVPQAVTRLGMRNTQKILVHSLYNGLTSFLQPQQDVMVHSQRCAVLANYIAQEAGRPAEERAKIWLGALMHDIGRQVLAYVFPEKYSKVVDLMKRENRPSYLAELEIFGTEHQRLGRFLAKKWNFPDYLTGIIGNHHSPTREKWNTLTLPVFCANSFLNEQEGIPFAAYFQNLEGYFFILLKKGQPWKDVSQAFSDAIQEPYQDLLS